MSASSSSAAASSALVVVFGGSGFIGRHVVRCLAQRGHRVRIACRRPDRAQEALQPSAAKLSDTWAGTLLSSHKVECVSADIMQPESVVASVADAEAVVNLVGILGESGKQTFEGLQVEGALCVAEAAKEQGARFIHVSAIGADPQARAQYARTKGLGEQYVSSAHPDSIKLRPSIVFGPGDDFFNRFAKMAKYSPVLPLIGGGETRFQPVYVGDVAEVIAKAVDGDLVKGSTWELGGPEVLTFKQCMEKMLEVTHMRRSFLSLPFSAAGWMGRAAAWMPASVAPITEDQVEMLKHDNVVSQKAEELNRTLRGAGVLEPKSLSAILPTYLSSGAEDVVAT